MTHRPRLDFLQLTSPLLRILSPLIGLDGEDLLKNLMLNSELGATQNGQSQLQAAGNA